jgi:hypothetical protein
MHTYINHEQSTQDIDFKEEKGINVLGFHKRLISFISTQGAWMGAGDDQILIGIYSLASTVNK